MNHSKDILIIEDESITRTMYVSFFQKIAPEYNLYEACNALEGLCLCFEKRPQLILLDMIMPEYSGEFILDVMEEGISKNILSFIPKIIVVSSIDNANELMELTKRLAVVSVMPKPLPFETLEELLKLHL
ncbi:response regulator of RpoS [Candidatus Magnetomorum sp. HK-1]|nr:response regulator of RpoS [Candidatus Magnetomorum sp. HK-1]